MPRKTHKYILQCTIGTDKDEETIKREIVKKFYYPVALQVFNDWGGYLKVTAPIIHATLYPVFKNNKEVRNELLDEILSYITENSNMYVSGKYGYIVFDKESRLFLKLNKEIRKYIEGE